MPAQRPDEQRDDKEDEKEEEQNFRDPRRASGEPAETENGGYDRDHEKDGCPVKHMAPLEEKVFESGEAASHKTTVAEAAAPNVRTPGQ